nr:hypothetical protein [Anaerolineae bacterium]
MSEEKAVALPEKSWRSRVFLFGGLIGAVLGLISAYFYVRAADEAHGPEGQPITPSSGDTVRLGLSLLSIVRTITEWGSR